MRDKEKNAKKEQRVQGRQEKRADKQSREKPLEAARLTLYWLRLGLSWAWP